MTTFQYKQNIYGRRNCEMNKSLLDCDLTNRTIKLMIYFKGQNTIANMERQKHLFDILHTILLDHNFKLDTGRKFNTKDKVNKLLWGN